RPVVRASKGKIRKGWPYFLMRPLQSREERMSRFGVFMGIGAALLLTASLHAEEPASGSGAGSSRFQRSRSRGFGGFADWDSRRGGYDRSRRQDAGDQDKKAGDDNRDRRDGRR